MREHLAVISEIYQMQNNHRQSWKEGPQRWLYVAKGRLVINTEENAKILKGTVYLNFI